MRTIFTSLLMVCVAGIMFAQDIFTNFSIDGTVLLFYSKERGGEKEAVVGPDVDIANVIIKYELEEGWMFFDEEVMPSDFSKNSKQTITLINEISPTTYNITVKRINLASLPFSLEFSDENKSAWTLSTVGWAGVKINSYPYIGNGDIIQFLIGFDEDPSDLTYELYAEWEDYGGNLNVDESADGVTWDNVVAYSEETNPIPGKDKKLRETVALQSTTRYVKWYCPSGTTFSILNNIKVNKAGGGSIDPVQAAKDIAYQPERGEIVFKQPVAKVELYNALGALTAVYTNPGNTLSIKDKVAGVAVLRITLTDGTVVYLKAI